MPYQAETMFKMDLSHNKAQLTILNEPPRVETGNTSPEPHKVERLRRIASFPLRCIDVRQEIEVCSMG